MQGPNGQMNGPQMNMPMGAPNMMPGYQNWTSPQQQGYGYGNSNAPNSYQGWGAPPQGPPPQWSNYNPQQPGTHHHTIFKTLFFFNCFPKQKKIYSRTKTLIQLPVYY